MRLLFLGAVMRFLLLERGGFPVRLFCTYLWKQKLGYQIVMI